MTSTESDILVSVIIVNYNAKSWMQRCYESLAKQTIAKRLQIILIDNISNDGSDQVGQDLMAGWPNTLFIQTGENAGFGRACNRAVKDATGKYLFLLNPDIWLEPDCIEQLANAAEKEQVAAMGPMVYNYDDYSFQGNGCNGFDLFGLVVGMREDEKPSRVFCSNGFFFLRKDVYLAIGGEDEKFFLYNEECDLSWRIWAAGYEIGYNPLARIHHRGAASVNPAGGTKVVEFRTSDSKRFYANRNHLLTLLKNSQHIMLLAVFTSTCLFFLEGLAGWVLSRRWSYFKRAFLGALVSIWQLRGYIAAERRRLGSIRKRGDFFVLKFFTFRLSRWWELKQMIKMGPPKLDAR